MRRHRQHAGPGQRDAGATGAGDVTKGDLSSLIFCSNYLTQPTCNQDLELHVSPPHPHQCAWLPKPGGVSHTPESVPGARIFHRSVLVHQTPHACPPALSTSGQREPGGPEEREAPVPKSNSDLRSILSGDVDSHNFGEDATGI